MQILAIDPGSEKSAYVIYNDGEIVEMGITKNQNMIYNINHGGHWADVLAIEMIASYGMAVGETVFDTCVWIGRFIQEWEHIDEGTYNLVYRKDVKIHLCNSMRAKDSNIRQAIIDRYPATGGGKLPQIGTKKQPGPLYGVKEDIWSALAVAITFSEGIK